MFKHKYICTVVLLIFALAIAIENTHNLSNDISNSDAITTPKLLNYQGRLTNLAGNVVTDSTYSITFRLFTGLSGGSSFWSETQNVQTSQGLFNVLLGSSTVIDTIPQSGNCYLEMQVNPNPAMTPRIRLVSSAYAYLAKKSDTANYALTANIQYVDSTRVSTNSHKLQGKDTVALSNKYVDEGQTNAITNTMITDNAVTSEKILDGTIQTIDLAFAPATRPLTPGVSNAEILDGSVTSGKILNNTILREDVATSFKAPYADTSDYTRNISIVYVDSSRIAVNAYNAYQLQGKDTSALDLRYVNEGQANSISSTMIIDGTITNADISTTAGISDTKLSGTGTLITNLNADVLDGYHASDFTSTASDYGRLGVATNLYEGTTTLTDKYVNESQANSISSTMITDGTITNADVSATAGISDTKLAGTATLITNFNADYLDGQHASAFALSGHAHTYVDSARIATNAYKLQGKDTIALSAKFVDEGQSAGGDLTGTYPNPSITNNAVTTGKILNGTILREDVATDFKAPYADTSDYVRNVNVSYVDSSRISDNSHKLQGKDTLALDLRYVNEGQINSVTSVMITDGTITRNDVTPTFKAPFSDTADYARSTPPVGIIDSARVALNAYNAYQLQGQDTLALSNKFVDEGQSAGGDLAGTYPNPSITSNAITTAKILNNTILREDVAATFKAPYADTSDYVRNINIIYVDSSRISANAHKLQGQDTIALSAKFVDEGQLNSITSIMITDGTITRNDVEINFKAPLADTADYTRMIPGAIDSAQVAANAHKLQGKDTIALSAKFVDEGQSNAISSGMITDEAITNVKLGANAVTSDKIQDGTIVTIDIADGAINSAKILDGTIVTADIADGAVTLTKHADNSVNSAKIVDGSVAVVDLNFAPVTRPLSPGVATTEIADNAITSAKIQDGQIQAADIADLNITTGKIGDAQVTSAKIPGGAITNNILADNAVTTDKILDGNIMTADIADLNVTTEKIADVQVTTAKIADGAINSSKILDGTIATADIADGAITNAKLTPNAVTTDKIQNGTILTEDLSFAPATRPLTPPIATSEIADGAVTTAKITDGAVNSAKILDGTVATIDIADAAVTVAKNADNSVNSAKIVDGSVATIDITDGAISMPKINQASATTGQVIKWTGSAWAPRPDSATGTPIGSAGGDLTGTYPNPTITTSAITSAKIADLNVTTVKITDGAINSSKILDGTIATADIADGAITNAKLTPNAVTTDKIQNGTILTEDLSFAPATRPLTPPIATSEIADGAVTLAKNADNSVNSAKIVDGSVATIDITDGAISMPKINQAGALTGQVLKWTGSAWEPKNDSIGGSLSGAAGGDLTGTYPNPSIATNAINSEKILDGSIRGADIAKPCTLSASVASPGAILNIRNSGTGNGIRLNQGGIYVDTSSNDGIYISRAGDDGIQIDSCNQFGLWIKGCNRGVSVDNSASYGVYSNSNNQRGGYFRNNNNDYYALTAWNNTGTGGTVKGLYVQGNAYATGGFGTKMGDKSGFATISPNIEVILSGSSSLADGISIINFDQTVREAISEEIPLRVIVTPTSECKGVFVANKSATGFSVKELASGRSTATFDWIAIGRIKGYEQTPYIVPVSAGEIELKPVNAEQRHKENISENRDNRGVK